MAQPWFVALLATLKEMIMAGSRHPGSLGSSGNSPIIDSGTLANVAYPLPGPIGLNAAAPSMPVASTEPEDAAIEALDLAPVARAAAYALKKAMSRLSVELLVIPSLK